MPLSFTWQRDRLVVPPLSLSLSHTHHSLSLTHHTLSLTHPLSLARTLSLGKGDDPCPYQGACPNGGAFGHIEPVWGIFSNHPLNDTTVYPDDWVVHSSDQDLNPYYRQFHTLEDTTAMDGNCANAQPGFGRNEMYPCINADTDYGIAVNGIKGSGAIPVSLSVNKQSEPDVREGQPPSILTGTVTASALTPGAKYTLYRYEGTETLPTDGTSGTTATHKTPFTPTAATWTFKDGFPIRSSTAQYYRVFADLA